jgi:hypothetical protein
LRVNERYFLWLLKKSLEVPQLPKLGDQKCIPRWRKSFIRHPSASSFQGESAERVFQQPLLITTAMWKATRDRRKVSVMKGVSLALLLYLLGSLAVGQTAANKVIPGSTSVCEIVEHPDRFEGQSVTLHARYNVNWEWGAWIVDERCDKGLWVALANGYSTPTYLSKLYIERNSAFYSFQKQERLLCNGMDLLCEFDFLEADFTGVVVGPNHFPERPFQHSSVLVVSNIAKPKLHRDEHPMDTRLPALPSEIPEPTQQ